jgi:hypothetical protein
MPVILNGVAQLVSKFEVSISVYTLDYLGVVSPLGVDAFYWLKFLMSTWQYNVELKELRLDVQITFQTLFSNKAQHLCPSHQYQNGIMDTQQQVNNLKVRTNPQVLLPQPYTLVCVVFLASLSAMIRFMFLLEKMSACQEWYNLLLMFLLLDSDFLKGMGKMKNQSCQGTIINHVPMVVILFRM